MHPGTIRYNIFKFHEVCMNGTDLFRRLNDSFIIRSTSRAMALQGWKDLAAGLPPDPDEDRPVPFLLARDSGDLGLAMLWIVQFTVVRPLLSAMIPCANDTLRACIESLHGDSIGAMAHSEPADNPVTYTVANSVVVLSGVKKYITGGTEADFLLVTARMPGEDKISSMFYIPSGKLPDGSITPVIQNSLKTTPHGSLRLDTFQLGKEYLFDSPANGIRRLVLSAGLLERILIMETLTGLVIYLRRALVHGNDALHGPLQEMASSIHEKFLVARKAFRSGEKILPVIPDTALLAEAVAPLKQSPAAPHDAAIAERLRDLAFLLSRIPGMKQ